MTFRIRTMALIFATLMLATSIFAACDTAGDTTPDATTEEMIRHALRAMVMKG